MLKPVLVLLETELDASRHRVSATLSILGEHQRVVLEFDPRLGLVRHVAMPKLLGFYPQAQRLVLDVLGRVEQGEALQLPVDLSEALRAQEGGRCAWDPLPLEAHEAQEREADAVDLKLLSTEWDVPAHGKVTLHVVLDGIARSIEGDAHRTPDGTDISSATVSPPLASTDRIRTLAVHRLLRRVVANRRVT